MGSASSSKSGSVKPTFEVFGGIFEHGFGFLNDFCMCAMGTQCHRERDTESPEGKKAGNDELFETWKYERRKASSNNKT